MPRPVPLTTLLSWVWVAHTIEVDNRFEAAGAERAGRLFRISLPMWTNGLRFVDEAGVTVDEMRARSRALCNIGGLERWGWLSVGATGVGRRNGFGTQRGVKGDTVLRPTRAGSYARRLWPHVVGEVEDRWRERFGDALIDGLREALARVVSPMPWSPSEVHPSDGFFTHLVDGGDQVDPYCPLVALLGQVLTAFTLEHESVARISLPLAANVLRAIGPAAPRIRDLPASTGLSKEGIAMAVGFLQRRRLAAAEPNRTIRLTPVGLDRLGEYRRLADRVSDDELRSALDALLAQRGALSEGLTPPEGCWRGERPYLAQTRRVMADPTAALPWHPMVLHRGGWPDAS